VSKDAPVIPLRPRPTAAVLQVRSDDELMQLAATGMLDAFEELVRRYQHPLRMFCGRMLSDGAQASDVAQEVLLEVWRASARYQAQGRFRSFLLTCARNRCLRSVRVRGKTTPLHESPAAARVVAGPDQLEAILAVERSRRIDRAMRRLSPKLREAVALRFSAGLAYREIAEVIGHREETVRSRVFFGLKRLRVLLGDERTGSA
jgi:RNA polymerase sigma-70 factor, ECF subfamily